MIEDLRRFPARAVGAAIALWSRAVSRASERRRWSTETSSMEPHVYYGYKRIPMKDEKVSGGLVKLQDLGQAFPNNLRNANLLYLVSSALPVNYDVTVKYAKKHASAIVLNQNGVGIPAYHGANTESINEPRRRLLQGSDWVIYQSRFCKASSDRFLAPREDRYSILYNPVDTDFFKPAGEACDIDQPVLLIGGSHHHAFRVHSAIRTLAAVHAKGMNATLEIAGRLAWQTNESQCRSELERWVDELDVRTAVRILGPYTQQDAPRIMNKADILLHTKYMDPCPRLVVEAMSCGLPVVYSDTGGVPELVGDRAGIGISPSDDWENIVEIDPDLAAEAVGKIVDNYSVYSSEARKRAVEKFDAADWLKEHEKLFRDLLARHEASGV